MLKLKPSGRSQICLMSDFKTHFTCGSTISDIKIIFSFLSTSCAAYGHWLSFIVYLINIYKIYYLKCQSGNGNRFVSYLSYFLQPSALHLSNAICTATTMHKFSKILCSLFHDNSGSNSNVLHTSVTLQQEPVHHGLKFNKLTFLAK